MVYLTSPGSAAEQCLPEKLLRSMRLRWAGNTPLLGYSAALSIASLGLLQRPSICPVRVRAEQCLRLEQKTVWPTDTFRHTADTMVYIIRTTNKNKSKQVQRQSNLLRTGPLLDRDFRAGSNNKTILSFTG